VESLGRRRRRPGPGRGLRLPGHVGEPRGPEGWRGYRDLIRAGSSDFHNDIRSLLVDGDRAAARLRYSGTHDGLLAGLPATGRRFTYAGAAFFTARAGKLAEAWVLGDLAGLRAQLNSGPLEDDPGSA
jgi:predicted ester cyclase